MSSMSTTACWSFVQFNLNVCSWGLLILHLGIICGPFWGSLILQSILGIICGLESLILWSGIMWSQAPLRRNKEEGVWLQIRIVAD